MFIQISSNLFEEDFIFCFTFAHKAWVSFEKNPVFESYFSAFCISIRDRTINIHYFLVIFAYFINILIKIISSIYSQVNNMKYPLKIHGTFSLSFANIFAKKVINFIKQPKKYRKSSRKFMFLSNHNDTTKSY